MPQLPSALTLRRLQANGAQVVILALRLASSSTMPVAAARPASPMPQLLPFALSDQIWLARGWSDVMLRHPDTLSEVTLVRLRISFFATLFVSCSLLCLLSW